MLFAVGIQNLVQGNMLSTILGHCDLDLVSRRIVPGAYCLHYTR